MSIKIINPASSSNVTASPSAQNYIINSAFDFWQRTSSGTGLTVPATTTAYGPDRWYLQNTVDQDSAIQSQTGVIDGSIFGAQAFVVNGGGTTGTINVWQALDNQSSINFYNKAASFSVNVLARSNVTQVGIQFFYATSEIKPTNAIGSEVLFTVNNSTFTLCTSNNVSIGTSQTRAGIIGVRIRVTAVSSGNVYDGGNGFTLEQAMLVVGSTVPSFQRSGPPELDFASCQRFFAKTYDLNTAVGTITNAGTMVTHASAGLTGANNVAANWSFPAQMRITPTITFYNPATGGSGTWRNFGAGTNIGFVTPFASSSQNASGTNSATVTVGNFLYGHIVAEAEI